MKEKIESNKVYRIDKGNFATQVPALVKICGTLKYAKREPINEDIFLEYVTKALAFGICIILVTFNEKQELTTTVVTFLKNNPIKGKILWIEWAWSDGKDLELGKKVFDKLEELARILGAKRIAGAMERGLAGVAKKYGLEKAYTVVEKIVKEVKKEVKTDVKNN